MSYLFLLSFIDLYIQVINDFSAIVNNKTINGNNLHGAWFHCWLSKWRLACPQYVYLPTKWIMYLNAHFSVQLQPNKYVIVNLVMEFINREYKLSLILPIKWMCCKEIAAFYELTYIAPDTYFLKFEFSKSIF